MDIRPRTSTEISKQSEIRAHLRGLPCTGSRRYSRDSYEKRQLRERQYRQGPSKIQRLRFDRQVGLRSVSGATEKSSSLDYTYRPRISSLHFLSKRRSIRECSYESAPLDYVPSIDHKPSHYCRKDHESSPLLDLWVIRFDRLGLEDESWDNVHWVWSSRSITSE